MKPFIFKKNTMKPFNFKKNNEDVVNTNVTSNVVYKEVLRNWS